VSPRAHHRGAGRHRKPGPPVAASLVAALGVALILASFVGWERAETFGPAARSVSRVASSPPAGPTVRAPHVARGRSGSPPSRPSPVPVRVVIPSIGVSAPVVRLGLNVDGTLQVPTGFLEAGWYEGGARPGDPGPAVIVGHVDSRTGPAVFYRLRELVPGSKVVVGMSDGGRRTFVVARVAEYAKATFPTRQVYGATPHPRLRLITCGGPFDDATGHYLDNVIVFADAVVSGLRRVGMHPSD
jgi:sortase (surface protein transpeptidase)